MMKRSICGFFISAAVLGSAIFGSAQSEVLNNQIVIQMAQAGLSPEIIIRKIANSTVAFDDSPAALIELKKAQLSDSIISAIVDKAMSTRKENKPAQFAYSDSDSAAAVRADSGGPRSKKEIVAAARTIALEKSSVQPSRQALEKELLKRPEFQATKLTLTRYKEHADLYVEIGFVSGSLITHRYVYRIYDRQSGTVIAAGETTSWGSLAENLARHIAKNLATVGT